MSKRDARAKQKVENRASNPACMKLMSVIYRMLKPHGCAWCGCPRSFLRKNWPLFEAFKAQIMRLDPRDYPACEAILSKIAASFVSKRPEPPKRAVTAYQSLKAYLATDAGKDKWRQVRFEALRSHHGRCDLCGRGARHGVTMHVDHIKPKSLHPELAFEPSNLQVLCEDCNLGKSNRDDTNFKA